MQSGIHPDWGIEDYEGWLRLAKADGAAAAPARVLADGDRAHVRRQRPARRTPCSRGCATPAWTRRRAPPPRSCTTACASASARTSCRSRAGCEIIEASHRAGLRSTVTVMFGHIEEPWELAEHMRVVRELQAAHRRLHRVRAAELHPVSHAARAHARRAGDLASRRTSSTPRRSGSALGRSVANLQASWVKMGLDAATEALRWGVNDLGGTLMEENISRLAGSYHGVRLEPADLVARRASRRPSGGRAHDALRAAPALRAARRRVAASPPVLPRRERLGWPDAGTRADHCRGPRGPARRDRAARDRGPRARWPSASRPRASWAISRRTPSTTSPRTTRRTSRRRSSA